MADCVKVSGGVSATRQMNKYYYSSDCALKFCSCDVSKSMMEDYEKYGVHLFTKHKDVLINAIESQVETITDIKDYEAEEFGFVKLILPATNVGKTGKKVEVALCFNCRRIFHTSEANTKDTATRTISISDKLDRHSNSAKDCSEKLRWESFYQFVKDNSKNEKLLSLLPEFKEEKKAKKGRPTGAKNKEKPAGGAGIETKATKKTIIKEVEKVKETEKTLVDGIYSEERNIEWYHSNFHLLLAKVEALEKKVEVYETAEKTYKSFGSHLETPARKEYLQMVNEADTVYNEEFKKSYSMYEECIDDDIIQENPDDPILPNLDYIVSNGIKQ
jgi:hypothetical protein